MRGVFPRRPSEPESFQADRTDLSEAGRIREEAPAASEPKYVRLAERDSREAPESISPQVAGEECVEPDGDILTPPLESHAPISASPVSTGLPTDGPRLMTPADKIGDLAVAIPGAEQAEASDAERREDEQPEEETSPPLPESVRRLPMVVANIPSAIRAPFHEETGPASALTYPGAERSHSPSAPLATQPERAERLADDAWRKPETLIETLRGLTAADPTKKWATEVLRRIKALGHAVAADSDESPDILERLAALGGQTAELAENISDRSLARNLRKTGYALGRRLDVWQEVVRLGAPRPVDRVAPETDPRKLAICLAEIDSLTGDSDEGRAWREYLLVDALKELADRQSSSEDRATRQLAQRALARLTQTPLTPHQQKFVASGPVAELRAELRHLAAEPVGATVVLRDIETYEQTNLPGDARRLALDCQNLALSPIEGRRRLAERVDLHYRNANLRIAVTEELINKLIPERNLEYALVNDTVLGLPVRGESLMATEVSVRMLPDPQKVRMALEVRGEISAATTADAGAAVRVHNDSESYYIARKPLEIDMRGVSVWPVEVGVQNQTDVRGVETPLDWVPLIGAGARWVAKSQSEQNKSAASQEVKQKVAAEARQRVDAEARERLTEFVKNMNQRVFDPLNALTLDPQLIAAETTEKRLTMRLRLAGEDQLGSHTPRPQALAGSLASVQLHESALNNCIQRLQLAGRTFTLPELSKHVADRLSRPTFWEISPEHADVKISFAENDPVVVRCRDGQIVLTLSIARLSKGTRYWRNFRIKAFYRPQINGRSAQLARDGVIHLIGRLSAGSQFVLRGIFSRALSKNNMWELAPPQIVDEPKLAGAAITQFVIDDGWIGVSLGPKSTATSTARRSHSNLR